MLPKRLLQTIYRINLVARRTRIRLAATKTAIQHAGSKLINSGGGDAPELFPIMDTDVGARTLTGSTQTIQDAASTERVCRIGDIIKYVNLFIQVAPRSTATTPAESQGWLEWAFLMIKESDTAVPVTNMGTQTLGQVCTNMYRNECIYTGNVPVGLNQPNSTSIVIKVPKFKQKIRIGDVWRFVSWFRSWDSTNDDLNNVRVIKSFLYKSYS